ncbi:MAG: MerR family transcriptional regulator [Oscillospiraceae bacterium]|nr:MerR family transcriptional regulator [Oscillospiraceae bacterium]
MGKYRAIPEGYMTVGEVAKKMGTTVRTLQYYDREKLLCPSAESEGGRRLYSNQDLIKLHQILSLKSLGFSLDDIRERLMPLDRPADVAAILEKQAADVREKIGVLSESLKEIEKLREEVLQMQQVDFKKYADIIVNLQMKNEFYYLIKHFDDELLEHVRDRFSKEGAFAFMDRFGRLSDEILQLQKDGISPGSEKGQALAKEFWEMVMEFADGDLRILPKLVKWGETLGNGNEWEKKQTLVNAWIGPALEIYFSELGADPFKGDSE